MNFLISDKIVCYEFFKIVKYRKWCPSMKDLNTAQIANIAHLKNKMLSITKKFIKTFVRLQNMGVVFNL